MWYVQNILIAYTILLAVIYIILIAIVFTHTSRHSCSTKITCIKSQFNLFVEKIDFVVGKCSYLKMYYKKKVKKKKETVSIKRKMHINSAFNLLRVFSFCNVISSDGITPGTPTGEVARYLLACTQIFTPF